MAKITDYPSITTIDANTILLADGSAGTGKILASDLAKYALETYAGSTLAGSAQSVKGAFNNAYALSLGTAIPSGANLTSYTAPGTFYISSNSIASSLSGLPESTAGRFVVETEGTTGVVRQIYRPYNSTLEYVRRISGATVTTWEKHPTRSEVDALNSKVNTKVSYETAFDVTMGTGGTYFYADRVGKTLFLEMVLRPSSAVSANTAIAHIKDISGISRTHWSAVTDMGEPVRLLMLQNGTLQTETAIAANRWLSTSCVCLMNSI